MTTTWVVVAHQTGARIMEHRSGYGRNLMALRELSNPDGRKKNQEIDSDRAGASGARGTGARRGMHREQSAHEHVVELFANTIATELRKDRAAGHFDALILVAEPRFLGLMRDALDAQTAHKVVGSLTKDLAAVEPRDIAGHVASVLPL